MLSSSWPPEWLQGEGSTNLSTRHRAQGQANVLHLLSKCRPTSFDSRRFWRQHWWCVTIKQQEGRASVTAHSNTEWTSFCQLGVLRMKSQPTLDPRCFLPIVQGTVPLQWLVGAGQEQDDKWCLRFCPSHVHVTTHLLERETLKKQFPMSSLHICVIARDMAPFTSISMWEAQ